MDEPHRISREIRSILPFVPIMLIAALVVVMLNNNGDANAGRTIFGSPVETATPTSTATTSAGTSALITGMVSRSDSCPDNAYPLANAYVWATSDKYLIAPATFTNISGTYSLTVPAPANVTFSAAATGYLTQSVGVLYVVPGQQVVNFCLPVVVATATPTPSKTPTITQTPNSSTYTPTPTNTPSDTATATPDQATSTATVSPTGTSTLTPTSTITRTATVTSTATTTATVAGSQRGIVSADTGGTVSTTDGRISVIVPAGAVDDNVTIVISPRSTSEVTVTPTPSRLGSSVFSVEAYKSGTPVSTFKQTVTLRAKYSSADLSAAGGDASRISLAYYNSSSRSWVATGSRVSSSDSTVEASITQIGTYALVISQSSSASATSTSTTGTARQLPRTGDNIDWIIILFVGGMTSILAGLAVRQLAMSQEP